MKRRPLAERFWEKVDKTDGCWVWTAAAQSGGYGHIAVRPGHNVLAHRVAWFLTYGEWPNDQLDHLCRNRLCVNPGHYVCAVCKRQRNRESIERRRTL